VTGEENATLGVLDLRTRRIIRTYPVGDDPDVLDLDPVRHRLFVACESGVITFGPNLGTRFVSENGGI